MFASQWWLRHFPPFSTSFKLTDKLVGDIFDEMDAEIAEIIAKRQNPVGESADSLVEVFLDEMDQMAYDRANGNEAPLKQSKYFQ